jgi:hypothetical protein
MMSTGTVIGYDPGGNGAHGFAELHFQDGKPTALSTVLLHTTEDVIARIEHLSEVHALGVDTLTCWSSGSGGWRPADRWLRTRYVDARASVMTPNRLSGSMGLNGMAVVIATRERFPKMVVTETHPKVLHFALATQRYGYAKSKADMDAMLAKTLGVSVALASEHEWDAAVSAFAALKGLLGDWPLDLHQLATAKGERLIHPAGGTHYFWPE